MFFSARSNSARSSPTFNKNPTTQRPQQQQQRQQAPNYNVFMSASNKPTNKPATSGGAGGGSQGWGNEIFQIIESFFFGAKFHLKILNSAFGTMSHRRSEIKSKF